MKTFCNYGAVSANGLMNLMGVIQETGGRLIDVVETLQAAHGDNYGTDN